MHAIRIYEYGDASKLLYQDVPLPDPKAGEVRVKVEAAGLNFTEIYQRQGAYKGTRAFPFILGGEFAGIVDAVGQGVTDFRMGDRVGTADGIGGYAEYAIAPATKLIALPTDISTEQAAALLLQGMTAHYLTHSTFPLKSGHTVLIHAAAGGVGLLLVQIAKKCGAQVIATVSTDDKAQLARAAGAHDVILYSKNDFEAEAKRLTNNKGVDVVYDAVGKTTFAKGLNCLKPRGYMVLYGQASGPVDPIDPQVLAQKGSLFLTRPNRAAHVLTREELEWRVNDLFKWLAAGELKLRIDRTFPLNETAEAHRYMEGRQTRGKVLLVP